MQMTSNQNITLCSEESTELVRVTLTLPMNVLALRQVFTGLVHDIYLRNFFTCGSPGCPPDLMRILEQVEHPAVGIDEKLARVPQHRPFKFTRAAYMSARMIPSDGYSPGADGGSWCSPFCSSSGAGKTGHIHRGAGRLIWYSEQTSIDLIIPIDTRSITTQTQRSRCAEDYGLVPLDGGNPNCYRPRVSVQKAPPWIHSRSLVHSGDEEGRWEYASEPGLGGHIEYKPVRPRNLARVVADNS
ncbi:hypothetical protein CERSUDRAFT_125193 [Gelatoporia subvermispora B]|uniref:Uncharacterized protein n=1 Tax=Ceriporiopsis subvermispora (strain B) TaxID=914234 RepID=M2PF99_CERS8|nr:hypothetical protein CERSUDRAFT_125193 [Gelatoporia subvermispora B]